jgi:hypothetical protein
MLAPVLDAAFWGTAGSAPETGDRQALRAVEALATVSLFLRYGNSATKSARDFF